jgi:hypothetical protein
MSAKARWYLSRHTSAPASLLSHMHDMATLLPQSPIIRRELRSIASAPAHVRVRTEFKELELELRAQHGLSGVVLDDDHFRARSLSDSDSSSSGSRPSLRVFTNGPLSEPTQMSQATSLSPIGYNGGPQAALAALNDAHFKLQSPGTNTLFGAGPVSTRDTSTTGGVSSSVSSVPVSPVACLYRFGTDNQTQTQTQTQTQAVDIGGIPRGARQASRSERTQSRNLSTRLVHGSPVLRAGAMMPTVAVTSGCLKTALTSPTPGVHTSVAARDERRRCRNCEKPFFSQCTEEPLEAASSFTSEGLGISSFCSTDCLWSFSLRSMDDNSTVGSTSMSH